MLHCHCLVFSRDGSVASECVVRGVDIMLTYNLLNLLSFFTYLCNVVQMMQDEVSETENIRKNLSIERMIVEGCDILLDVNQTFVRQGKTSV